MAAHPLPESSSSGIASGVPYVAFPPEDGADPAKPSVVVWHMMDAPRTPEAFAAAMPLAGLDAWRFYLGLPLSGARLPVGGFDELMRLAYEDVVLNLQWPTVRDAVAEFPGTLAALRKRFGLPDTQVGVVGASIGAAVALTVLAERIVDVSCAVLVSPLIQLQRAIEAGERRFGFEYRWSEASRAVASQLDFVARAGEVADPGAALLMIRGDEDDDGFKVPASRLYDALVARYKEPARADLRTIAGMGHALAEEPGTEPAPQTNHASAVDSLAVTWLQKHLC